MAHRSDHEMQLTVAKHLMLAFVMVTYIKFTKRCDSSDDIPRFFWVLFRATVLHG